MKSEIVYKKGDPAKPLVVFIHGIGMDANVWADPSKARILGGKYPLSILLGNMEPRNSFDDLSDLGFPVIAWSQLDQAGEAASSFGELHEIVETYAGAAQKVILIGHSRGGILARKLSDENIFNIKTVITIATPHLGSVIAKWATRLSPLASGLSKVLETCGGNSSRSALRRIAAFLSGKGIREMLPDSVLIRTLKPFPANEVKAISIGGTDPALIKICGKSLGSIFPGTMLPAELCEGIGDGFVSARSSVYPNGHEHKNFHAHHAGIIFNIEAREYIKKIVNELIGG